MAWPTSSSSARCRQGRRRAPGAGLGARRPCRRDGRRGCTGSPPRCDLAIDGDRNPHGRQRIQRPGRRRSARPARLDPGVDPRPARGCVDTWQLASAPVAAGRAAARSQRPRRRGPAVAPPVADRRRSPPRTRLRVAAGRYTQSPGYEKTAQSDYVLDFTSAAAGRLRSERAVQASAGVEQALGGGVSVRLEGYVKRFTDALDRTARIPTADRLARIARYDFPADAGLEHPGRSAHHDRAHQRRPWARLRLRRVHVASAGARRRPPSWLGQLHLGPGRTRGLRPALSLRVRPAARVHGGDVARSDARAGSWRRRRAWRRASRGPRRSACASPAVEDTTDRDGDGVTDEILPDRDSAGRLVYAVDFGGVGNLNGARLPRVRARRRARHLASARRRRTLGALRRGHQPARPAERRGARPAPGVRPDVRSPADRRGARPGAFRACRHWGYASGSDRSGCASHLRRALHQLARSPAR